MREVAGRVEVDIALLHLGGVRFPVTGPMRYTMTARDALELCGLIQPRTAIPIHYEGWKHFREGRDAIEREFAHAPEDIRARDPMGADRRRGQPDVASPPLAAVAATNSTNASTAARAGPTRERIRCQSRAAGPGSTAIAPTSFASSSAATASCDTNETPRPARAACLIAPLEPTVSVGRRCRRREELLVDGPRAGARLAQQPAAPASASGATRSRRPAGRPPR